MAAVHEEPLILDADAYEGRERGAETIRAILTGACPCDECGDIVRWQCSQNACCAVFADWVRTGKIEPGDRNPTRERWHRLFRGTGGLPGRPPLTRTHAEDD